MIKKKKRTMSSKQGKSNTVLVLLAGALGMVALWYVLGHDTCEGCMHECALLGDEKDACLKKCQARGLCLKKKTDAAAAGGGDTTIGGGGGGGDPETTTDTKDPAFMVTGSYAYQAQPSSQFMEGVPGYYETSINQ